MKLACKVTCKRKVRTSQKRIPAKCWGPQGYGKCNRKQSAVGAKPKGVVFTDRLKRMCQAHAAPQEIAGMTNPIRSKCVGKLSSGVISPPYRLRALATKPLDEWLLPGLIVRRQNPAYSLPPLYNAERRTMSAELQL